MRRLMKREGEAADVDVTSFINLVVVLIPALLMGMVLSHITVLDIKLPDIAAASSSQLEPQAQLELVVRADYVDINYPAGMRLKRIEKTPQDKHDYESLKRHLQEIKRQLAEKGIAKRDINVLSEKTTDYQTLVSVMDSVRSYKAVIGTSVVHAELFPDVSLGDAPAISVGETEQTQALKAEGVAQ